jgi:hypothetical protein
MNTPQPSRWSELFDIAMSIIDQANARGIDMNSWSFGGGTALMLQIDHRDSHDIDLFIDDPQYLPYLNPQTQGYDLLLSPSDYETDGSRALKIVFTGIGEIDFICCDPVTEAPCTKAEILGHRIMLETPAEILSKKIVFRGSQMQPRDMFDIAATAEALGKDYVIDTLAAFPSKCQAALEVAHRMDARLVESVTARLLVTEKYSPLRARAQAITQDILAGAISKSA